MGRYQWKSLFNNIKCNTVTLEPNRNTGRLGQPNPEEAERNKFKHNSKRMMDKFKEEIKNLLKEMEERQTKNGRNQQIS